MSETPASAGNRDRPRLYEIRLKGHLDGRWAGCGPIHKHRTEGLCCAPTRCAFDPPMWKRGRLSTDSPHLRSQLRRTWYAAGPVVLHRVHSGNDDDDEYFSSLYRHKERV